MARKADAQLLIGRAAKTAISELAMMMSAETGRRISQAEVVERAIEALRRERLNARES